MSRVAEPPLPVRIYTPESPLRRPGEMVRQMVADLLASRELAWRLFVRDFSAQYRQSLLGYVWVILPPLLSMLVWVFLNSQGILNLAPTGVPYPVYVLTGLLLWESFTAALNAPSTQIAGAAGMLAKINFPREALLLAGLGHVLFNTSIRLLLLMGAFLWFQLPVPLTILAVPVGVLAIVGLGFMLGMLLVPLGILYQDVDRVVTAGLGIVFFLTPVVYTPPTSWPATLLVQLNPISPLLVTTREMLTTGEFTCLGSFLAICGVTAMGIVGGLILYRLAMPHLIARMSS